MARGGRLCRPEFSDALLAVGSGPHVGVVDGVSLEGPAAFVEEFVVEVAEPRGVVEAGGAAAATPDDVVQLDGGVAAARERASPAVAVPGGAALRGGELVVELADVEDLPVAAEHDRHDAGVTGEPPRRFRADLRTGRQRQPLLTQLVLQGL